VGWGVLGGGGVGGGGGRGVIRHRLSAVDIVSLWVTKIRPPGPFEWSTINCEFKKPELHGEGGVLQVWVRVLGW